MMFLCCVDPIFIWKSSNLFGDRVLHKFVCINCGKIIETEGYGNEIRLEHLV